MFPSPVMHYFYSDALWDGNQTIHNTARVTINFKIMCYEKNLFIIFFGVCIFAIIWITDKRNKGFFFIFDTDFIKVKHQIRPYVLNWYLTVIVGIKNKKSYILYIYISSNKQDRYFTWAPSVDIEDLPVWKCMDFMIFLKSVDTRNSYFWFLLL